MLQCPNCNRKQSPAVIVCDCGYDLQAYQEAQKANRVQRRVASRPYLWLPIWRGVLRLAGSFTLISGLISTYELIANEASYGLVLAGLVITMLASVAAFASAEVISVLLDLRAQNNEILAKLGSTASVSDKTTQRG